MAKKSVKKTKAPANAGAVNTAESAVKPGITALKREFHYSGIVLDDIGTDKSVSDVKDFYSGIYPDLVNAAVKGPTLDGDKEIWKFEVKLGTKG